MLPTNSKSESRRIGPKEAETLARAAFSEARSHGTAAGSVGCGVLLNLGECAYEARSASEALENFSRATSCAEQKGRSEQKALAESRMRATLAETVELIVRFRALDLRDIRLATKPDGGSKPGAEVNPRLIQSEVGAAHATVFSGKTALLLRAENCVNPVRITVDLPERKPKAKQPIVVVNVGQLRCRNGTLEASNPEPVVSIQ
jgi:hypothetical protein